MVKIKNTGYEPEPSQPLFTRTRVKIGALALTSILALSLIGMTVTGSSSDDDDAKTNANAVAQDASAGFDYAAWSNPERLDMDADEDTFLFEGITIEGSVMAIVEGSVTGFGKADDDNVHHLLVAMDGDKRQPVFVRYVSDTRTTPFEVDETLAATGESLHLLGKDGIYVPTIDAEWVGE